MIYLDNAATSFPKPESVYLALDKFARTTLANPGRAGHKMALAAEHALTDARHRLNRFFNGASPERFAFTLNATDALNMAFKGVLNPGDRVVTSDLEHNSVMRPLTAMADAGMIVLDKVKAGTDGRLDPDDLRKALAKPAKLVAVTHASNVTGAVQPIQELGLVCQERGAMFLVDCAQTAGVIPVDIRSMHIDLLAFPGHKGLFGPSGTGALYVAPNVKIRAWREGGTGGDSSTPTQPKDFPYFLEGGTPNVLGVAGMVAGLDYVEKETLEKIHSHELQLCDILRDAFEGKDGFRFFSPRVGKNRVGTLSFTYEMIPATEIGGILDQAFDIAIRPGLHCAPYAHKALGTFPDGTVRVSPGPFNTVADMEKLVAALSDITTGL